MTDRIDVEGKPIRLGVRIIPAQAFSLNHPDVEAEQPGVFEAYDVETGRRVDCVTDIAVSMGIDALSTVTLTAYARISAQPEAP